MIDFYRLQGISARSVFSYYPEHEKSPITDRHQPLFGKHLFPQMFQIT